MIATGSHGVRHNRSDSTHACARYIMGRDRTELHTLMELLPGGGRREETKFGQQVYSDGESRAEKRLEEARQGGGFLYNKGRSTEA